MALNPVLHEDPRARGQAIFLRAEPRATRLGKTPPAGSHMLAERLRLVKIIDVVRNHQSVKIIACGDSRYGFAVVCGAGARGAVASLLHLKCARDGLSVLRSQNPIGRSVRS